MQSVELTLIKIIGDHFYENTGKLRKVEFNGRNFFDRYERIDSQLTMSIQKEHFEGKRVIAQRQRYRARINEHQLRPGTIIS